MQIRMFFLSADCKESLFILFGIFLNNKSEMIFSSGTENWNKFVFPIKFELIVFEFILCRYFKNSVFLEKKTLFSQQALLVCIQPVERSWNLNEEIWIKYSTNSITQNGTNMYFIVHPSIWFIIVFDECYFQTASGLRNYWMEMTLSASNKKTIGINHSKCQLSRNHMLTASFLPVGHIVQGEWWHDALHPAHFIGSCRGWMTKELP